MEVEFFVAGRPVPKGSTRAFVVNGRARITDTSGVSGKSWASMINGTAQDCMRGRPPFEGPVVVHLLFSLQRPKSHPKHRRTWPTTRPDLDKLVRAVLDACTANVFLDDSQVVRLECGKVWAGIDTPLGPGVHVSIQAANPANLIPLTEPQALPL